MRLAAARLHASTSTSRRASHRSGSRPPIARGRRVGATVRARLRAATRGAPAPARCPPRPARSSATVRRLRAASGTPACTSQNLTTGRGRRVERPGRVPGRFDAEARDRGHRAGAPSTASRVPARPLDASVPDDADLFGQRVGERVSTLLGGSTSGGVGARQRADALDRPRATPRCTAATSSTRDRSRALAPRASRSRVVEQPTWGVGKRTTAFDLARLIARDLARERRPRARCATAARLHARRGALSPLRARAGARPGEARPLVGGAGVMVLHKAGWLDAARHDAGLVVWRGGVFVAAVMTYRAGGAGSLGRARGARRRGGAPPFPRLTHERREGAVGRPRYEPASALGVRCLPILRSGGRWWIAEWLVPIGAASARLCEPSVRVGSDSRTGAIATFSVLLR